MDIKLGPGYILIFAIQKSDYFFYFEIATPAYGGLAMTAKLIFLARDEEAFALLSLRGFPKGSRGNLNPFCHCYGLSYGEPVAISF
jgi:hypothetical protein